MRILSRYVFRQTAGALVLILVSLTGVTWIAVALRQLDLMTTQGQNVLSFLAMTTLAIPSMMALIAPIALLIASIHVLNRLNGQRVVLNYEQHKGVPGSCFGDTEYFIVGVRPVGTM